MSATATTIDRAATVAHIVALHSETALVFHRHHIDFCCRGDVTVAQACAGRAEDPEVLFLELEQAVRERAGESPEEPLATLTTPALLALIVHRHHGYLRRVVPRVGPLIEKVAVVHATHNPRLAVLRDAFEELVDTLEPHLDFEEEVLFPELARQGELSASARMHLDEMAKEHLGVGALLAQIRELADDFTTPPWGCSSYRALMAELRQLEGDVLQHVHLENHLLMPRFAEKESLLS